MTFESTMPWQLVCFIEVARRKKFKLSVNYFCMIILFICSGLSKRMKFSDDLIYIIFHIATRIANSFNKSRKYLKLRVIPQAVLPHSNFAITWELPLRQRASGLRRGRRLPSYLESCGSRSDIPPCAGWWCLLRYSWICSWSDLNVHESFDNSILWLYRYYAQSLGQPEAIVILILP